MPAFKDFVEANPSVDFAEGASKFVMLDELGENAEGTVTALKTELSATFDAAYGPLPELRATGVYFPAIGALETNRTPSEATIHFVPWAQSGYVVDRMTLRILATAGSSGAVCRFGIYASAAGGQYPGALLAEADSTQAVETINATVTASFTGGVNVSPGVAWLAIAIQGGASTRPLVQAVQGNNPYVPGSGASATACYIQASVSGAFPSTADVPSPTGSNTNFFAPNIGVRVSGTYAP